MITRPHAFRVYGEPAPKGSLAGRCLTHPKIGKVCQQAARVVMSEDANRGRPWRRAIETAAPVHITEQADQHQPIKATMTFAVTRTHAARDRPYPSVRSALSIGGDLDKFVRLVLDALESAKVLTDDAQVVELTARKVYVDSPLWGRQGPGLYLRLEPAVVMPAMLPVEVTSG